MKLSRFHNWALVSIALLCLPAPRASAASSYCPACTAAIAGTGAAVVGLIGASIYFVHRSHTSLTGCVLQSADGLTLTAKGGKKYELTSVPPDLKAHQRVLLRGHKGTSTSGHIFRVDHISRDYGQCAQ